MDITTFVIFESSQAGFRIVFNFSYFATRLMIIAFCGYSGSGKSTLLNAAKRLDFFFNKAVSVKEEDNFYPTKLFKMVLGTDRFKEHKAKLFLSTDVDRQPSLIRRLAPYVYSFIVYTEFLFDYLKYEIIDKDTLVLRDTYIYDYVITLNENLNFNNRFVDHLFRKFPRPYLIFLVDVKRETALERNRGNKGWMNHTGTRVEYYERVLEKYRQIAKEKDLIKLDNNKPLESSLKVIERSLLIKERLGKIKRVVICGNDGSGKTTLANRFHDYCNRLNVRSKIVHPYHNTLLYRVLLRFGFFKSGSGAEEIYAESRAKAREINKKGKPFIWGLLHYIDFYTQYLFLVFFYRNRILVFDRYFYDFIVDFKLYRVGGRRFFERLIPDVKNKFCLVCEPEVSYKRKPENTLEFFRLCYNEYRRLANKHRMEIIDTTAKEINSVFELFLPKLKNG